MTSSWSVVGSDIVLKVLLLAFIIGTVGPPWAISPCFGSRTRLLAGLDLDPGNGSLYWYGLDMNSGWRTEWIEGSHEGFVRPPIFPTPNGSSELVVSKAERISTRAGRSVRDAGRSDQTSCLPAWPKSSESLRILALDKYPKEKSIIGSNKEARSSAQSPVHAVRAKRAKREKSRSESELARPKLILA
ncbi:hypothetical protein F2Q68_00015698 [Brassica cretica]|uniref:Uncharacterized protein n=1 Tax=Brassica cretica TaxID=69181 RepID=A0A8S9HC30_BRACR|nr:hypothetical protein F2Q68_00015698 [Brassica cretica]